MSSELINLAHFSKKEMKYIVRRKLAKNFHFEFERWREERAQRVGKIIPDSQHWFIKNKSTVESRYSKDFGQQTKLYYIGILYYFYTYESWNFPKSPFVWVFSEKEVAWHKKSHTEPSGWAIFWEVFSGFQSFNLWFAQS